MNTPNTNPTESAVSAPDSLPEQGVVITKKSEWIKAMIHDTLEGERSGAFDAALREEDLTDLCEYFYGMRCSPHRSNPLFGGAFRSLMHRVRRILNERGVHSITRAGAWPHTIKL